ncbi:hypothetical protein F5141DRAFT_1062663 [Pisolithus sp. B1]|nr:hypothetical protein F5141DRAFT_1062663 [Pisolithus sp. B1]
MYLGFANPSRWNTPMYGSSLEVFPLRFSLGSDIEESTGLVTATTSLRVSTIRYCQAKDLGDYFSGILKFFGVIYWTPRTSALLQCGTLNAFTYHILFEEVIIFISSSFPIRPHADMWREYDDVPLIGVKAFNLTATRAVFHQEKARARYMYHSGNSHFFKLLGLSATTPVGPVDVSGRWGDTIVCTLCTGGLNGDLKEVL